MRISRAGRRSTAVSPRSRRLRWYSGAAVMVLATLTTACTTQGSGGEAQGVCAITALYKGRTYTQVANVDFSIGKALGPAGYPPCDDTPADDDATGPEPTTAYAVDGLNPRNAIAVRYTSDEVMLLAHHTDGSLPPEVKSLTRG